jgi:oxidoreductase
VRRINTLTGRSALIVGATGATGKHLLRHLLSTPEYTSVGEYGRRVTSVDDIFTGKDKLEQHQIDFDKLGETDDQGLKAKHWDTVFITYVHFQYRNRQ